MSTIGIVCEFNPFHNGHKYLIDAVRKDGDTVVCVMSGNFTQRAEPAAFEAQYRVRAALNNGADIVLELPFVYATGTAEIFAKNAVKILCDFGCGKIAFGAENADKNILLKAAEIVSSDSFEEEINNELKNDISYPTARENAFKKHGIDFDLSQPNNILALEYVREIRRNYPDVEILPVERIAVAHDSDETNSGFASASLLRQMFENGEDISGFVPESAIPIYAECKQNGDCAVKDKYSLCILSVLRSKLDDGKTDTAYMTEELYNRINSALKNTNRLDGLFDKAKTKRYTHSRVRRAVLCRAFAVTKDDLVLSAPYVRVLGFNENAAEALGELSKKSKLPVITTVKQMKALRDKNAERVALLSTRADEFYNMIIGSPKESPAQSTGQIIKIK